jgi:hypothetical protein
VSNFLGGAAASNQKAAPPDRAVRMATFILHDFEDDRILRYTGNETRLLSFMSERRVNSGTTEQKKTTRRRSLCSIALMGAESGCENTRPPI